MYEEVVQVVLVVDMAVVVFCCYGSGSVGGRSMRGSGYCSCCELLTPVLKRSKYEGNPEPLDLYDDLGIFVDFQEVVADGIPPYVIRWVGGVDGASGSEEKEYPLTPAGESEMYC
jgi:hypothetical protein